MYADEEYLKKDYCALFGFTNNLAYYCGLCPFQNDKDSCPRAYALFALMMKKRFEARLKQINGEGGTQL